MSASHLVGSEDGYQLGVSMRKGGWQQREQRSPHSPRWGGVSRICEFAWFKWYYTEWQGPGPVERTLSKRNAVRRDMREVNGSQTESTSSMSMTREVGGSQGRFWVSLKSPAGLLLTAPGKRASTMGCHRKDNATFVLLSSPPFTGPKARWIRRIGVKQRRRRGNSSGRGVKERTCLFLSLLPCHLTLEKDVMQEKNIWAKYFGGTEILFSML